MGFQHLLHTIENFAELDSLAGSKPCVFCLENKQFHVWDGVGFTTFLNEDDITALLEAIELLPGPPGADGQDGAQGIQGIQGVQGNPGVDGVRTATTEFGYATGAGGTVTQATNKSTAVTLNKLCGQITMHTAALAAGAIISFTLNNSTILTNDLIVANHISGGTFGPYLINARATGSGTAVITVRNTSAGSLGEAIVIRFAIVRGVVT